MTKNYDKNPEYDRASRVKAVLVGWLAGYLFNYRDVWCRNRRRKTDVDSAFPIH